MVRKTTRIGTRKSAAKPPPGGKTRLKAAVTILSAPKGARTLTHRKIKQAVVKVFEARYGADG